MKANCITIAMDFRVNRVWLWVLWVLWRGMAEGALGGRAFGREGGSRAAELYIICQLRSHPHPLHEFRALRIRFLIVLLSISSLRVFSRI